MTDLTQFDFWNQLLPEMKQSCVKHMDFMGRLHLRTMSKSDRAIVESTRFHIDKVAIGSFHDELFLEIFVNEQEKYKLIAENEQLLNDQSIPLLAFLLNCGDIDELESSEYKDFTEDAITKVKAGAPFKIKKIVGDTSEQMMLFLKNCAHDVIKAVHLEPFQNRDFPIDEIMNMDWLRRISYWKIQDFSIIPGKLVSAFPAGLVSAFPVELAKKWISYDLPIRTKLELFTIDHEVLKLFTSAFETPDYPNLTEKQSDCARINTNNERKDILMFTHEREYEAKKKYVMLVIRADLRTESMECKNLREEHFPPA